MEELLNLKKEIETLKRAAEISEINTDQKQAQAKFESLYNQQLQIAEEAKRQCSIVKQQNRELVEMLKERDSKIEE